MIAKKIATRIQYPFLALALISCAHTSSKEIQKGDQLAQQCGIDQNRSPADACTNLFNANREQNNEQAKAQDKDDKNDKGGKNKNDNVLKLEDGHVALIATKGKNIESPVVSPDGKKVIVMSDLGKAPVDMIVKDLADPNDRGRKIRRFPWNIFIKGSFVGDPDHIVACELRYKPGALFKTVRNYFRTREWDPVGYRSVISFFENGKRTGMLDATDFNLPEKTFLQHPRVSPDQKWLVFYVQPSTEAPDPSTQGVYVYNFQTKKTTYLGNFADKHPTWDNKGQRIFFHEQGKMGKAEVARVGYYDLDFTNDEVKVKNRVVLSQAGHALGESYVYQKHPAYHRGLNLVFFHAKEGKDCAADGPDCSKVIGAISLDHPEAGPMYLKLQYNGEKVKHAEHVDLTDQSNSPLYFIGRVGDDKTDHLLSADFAALQKLREKFNLH